MKPEFDGKLRANPMAEAIGAMQPEWTHCANMPTPERFGERDLECARVIGILDQSWRRRAGCKGPACAGLLAARGLVVPEQANRFSETSDGGIVARLGRGEFLVEDGSGQSLVDQLGKLDGQAGAWPVLRQDGSLLLTGERLGDLLLQTCSLDFARLGSEPGQLAMTSMIGVAVTALWVKAPGSLEGRALRLWFDGTYGDYVWSTLVEIARESGGGPAGLSATR